MAEYNQKQELIWGQARTVSALAVKHHESSIATRKNADIAANDLNKVFNKATHSYIDKELYD